MKMFFLRVVPFLVVGMMTSTGMATDLMKPEQVQVSLVDGDGKAVDCKNIESLRDGKKQAGGVAGGARMNIRVDFSVPVAPTRMKINYLRGKGARAGIIHNVEVFADKGNGGLESIAVFYPTAGKPHTKEKLSRELVLDLPKVKSRVLQVNLCSDSGKVRVQELEILGNGEELKAIKASKKTPTPDLAVKRENPMRDITIAKTEQRELKLDLFLPDNVKNPPLVVAIHGGGWRSNSYKNCPVPWLPGYGFAVASLDYRFSKEKLFPAQIHDVKAAVRWLRANADKYGYDTTRIGVIGSSAGGHLSTLLGVSAGNKELEGTVGDHLDQSSSVQAIVDMYGPMDFVKRSKDQPHKTDKPNGPVYQLIGGPVTKNLEKAKFASPATYVTKDDPPLLIVHGDKDNTVLMNQSEHIRDLYKQNGLEVHLEMVPGGAHGGEEFHTAERQKLIADFFNKHLRPKSE